MFEFTPLDGMSRALMLRKQKETIYYWTAMHHLKGAFLAWGSDTTALINHYRYEETDSKMIESMSNAAVRGEITVKKLSNLLERIDEYLRDLDRRLGDGTKWHTAQDIIDMANETQGD